MSKFPNQLALVSVLGVSAVALAVGLSERAANNPGAHAPVATDAVAAHEPAAAEPAAAEPVAIAEVPAEETQAETAVEAVTETAATAAGAAPVVATAAAVVDGATDTLSGQGDTSPVAGGDVALAHGKYGLGRPALPEEIHAWDRNIMPDGSGLPDGEGDVWTGDEIFGEYCAVCHGDFAEGVDNWPKLAGGMNTLDHEDPLKTVGSYWPYLSTTYDYVRRSMPFGNAQTLSDDEVYSIVAYILYSNDLVDEDFVLSKDTFLDVEMPNAGGFIVDDRAETELAQFSVEPCMENCKETVEITMRAAVLDVTPEETKAKKIKKLIKETDPKAPKDAAAAQATADAPVEVAAAPATETPAEATPEVAEATPAATAAPDPALVAAGEKVFKKCQACHQVGEGAKNRTGPVLNGVIGRTAGTAEGFKYSKVVLEAGEGGLVWNEETLAEYLANPKAYLKGNKMAFVGLKKPDDVTAVVAFLESHP